MDNSKSTKRALALSVMAMVLCVTMLIGTTFAWFTDTASTAVNKIQAGTLDVQLLDENGASVEGQTLKWKTADNRAQSAILWEPGCTYELQPVQIKNNGNLALKYKIVISGIAGDAELNEAIDWSYKLANESDFAIADEGHLLAGESTGLITISGHMKETAGNEYQGLSIDGIGITVVATQDTVENDSYGNRYDLAAEYEDASVPSTATVKTAAELKAVLTAFTDAGSGDSVVTIDEDIILAEGETWIPVTVDGYNGAGVITINGNGHTIKGLNAPLIAGGFAGESGVVINKLTIENANIDDTYADQGLGAFICSIDSMPKIELNECHLKNSIITSTSGARVGGLIGWTAGYNNPNDGPVDTYITITNCSVEDCSITAAGSVGGIIGHAGSNPATYHTITGCTITGTTLNSTDDGGWRVGVVVGTANVGEVTISGTTESGNTLTQTGKTAPEHSNLYGRFVPQNGSGKLTIDGVEITA